jgi:hypothetical protein
MKKAITIMITATFMSIMTLSPIYASGDKHHGDVGIGEVNQGETGSDKGNAQGDDAQDNQTN